MGSMLPTILLVSAFILILLISLSSAETIPYIVDGKTGEIEFRNYPALVLATVESTGNDAGFDLLFKFISGNNKAKNTIPMTAPVVSDATTISFVMPPEKTGPDIPEPLDSRVRIVTVPGREVAVIRFGGYASEEDVAAAMSRLQQGLTNEGIKSVGQMFLMRYDPPWMPGFFRRNEVGIEIQR